MKEIYITEGQLGMALRVNVHSYVPSGKPSECDPNDGEMEYSVVLEVDGEDVQVELPPRIMRQIDEVVIAEMEKEIELEKLNREDIIWITQ